MRLKTLEEGLKNGSSFSMNTKGSPKSDKSTNFFGILSSNTRTKKRSTSQPRASTITKTAMEMLNEKQTSVKNPASESLSKKSLWASRNRIVDNSGKENAEMNKNTTVSEKIQSKDAVTEVEVADTNCEDSVSGVLYDRLQKEVIHLRKTSELKDMTLHSKDEEIKVRY